MSSTASNTFGVGDHMRRPLDMNELDSEASEMSWGPGLTPKGLENAQPSEGGRYKGQSPECERHIGVSR
jgi:hypothetical protein